MDCLRGLGMLACVLNTSLLLNLFLIHKPAHPRLLPEYEQWNDRIQIIASISGEECFACLLCERTIVFYVPLPIWMGSTMIIGPLNVMKDVKCF